MATREALVGHGNGSDRRATACRAAWVVAACLLLSAGCRSTPQERGPAWSQFEDNARVVRAAKRSYQLGHGLSDGTPVTWYDLSFCLPGNWRPVCLEGGEVLPGALGQPMRCSVHGEAAR